MEQSDIERHFTRHFDFFNLLGEIRFEQHRLQTMMISGYSRYLGNGNKPQQANVTEKEQNNSRFKNAIYCP